MLLQRGRVVFRNHSAHTCSHRIFVAYGFGMIREKYYGRLRFQKPELSCSLKTIHTRHRKIDDDQIGVELMHFSKGILPINRFAADFDTGLVFEKEAHGSADHITVIDNKNGLRQRRLPAEVTAYAGEHLVTYATVPEGTLQAYTGIALLT